jgi:AbiJ N-terminal domain 3
MPELQGHPLHLFRLRGGHVGVAVVLAFKGQWPRGWSFLSSQSISRPGMRKLPSTDRRFQNAERYIRQHRINYHDWEDDWVSYDTRFELNLQSSAQLLLILQP